MADPQPSFSSKIDTSGRVKIPAEVLEKWDWKSGDIVAFYIMYGSEKLLLGKYKPPELDKETLDLLLSDKKLASDINR